MTTQDIEPALAAIIEPDCDPDVRARYATLAARAAECEFGLLEDDVVIVDTETTGLDFKNCELIEIAAARLRGREIVEEFDLFVRPEKKIPVEIIQLTHITNNMVEDAPCAKEALEAFCAFAGDSPLIAHNATFDRHFLEKGAGHAVGAAWVDSLELSRIVLPCLTSHKLMDLSRAFGLTPSTHRAIDDVRATCGLWRVLLTAAADLPLGLAGYLADLYPEVPWSYRPIFAQIAATSPEMPFSLLDTRVDRCGHHDMTARIDARLLMEQGNMQFPEAAEIEREFTPEGVVGRMYAGWEPRSEQVAMACEVNTAFGTSTHAAIEAGTGVGKSVAYLLPAALLAQRNHITVGIATKSNALTDQLMTRELPLLSQSLGKPLDYVALKGYDNYPCLRKVERLAMQGSSRRRSRRSARASEQEELRAQEQAAASAAVEVEDASEGDQVPGAPAPSEDVINAIAAIYAYASQRALGDLNSLGIRWGKIQRSDLTCTSSECQKRRCPYFPNRCFLHAARRRAAAADIVVTNHSLLYRALGSDVDILPPIRYWVVDEAHTAEVEARRQWALHVNSREMALCFEKLGAGGPGTLAALSKEAASIPGGQVALGALARTGGEVARARIASTTFFDDVRRLSPKQGRKGGYEAETVWLSSEVRATPAYAQLAESGAAFAEMLEKAIKAGSEAAACLTDGEASSGHSQRLDDRLGELTRCVQTMRDALCALRLVLDGTNDRYVYSAGIERRGGFESFELTAELIDVGAEFARRWYPEVESVVYASATIAVGEEFEHFNHQVGFDQLERGSVRSLRLSSSYDFDRNMRVLVTKDMPDPNAPDYGEALAKLLVDVHLSMGGSTLTLFTNRRDMEQAFERVEPVLASHGQLLMCQARSSNARTLRDRFIADPSSSLFALKSFWEGFDAAGDTLRCVVIPKLPFARPTDPLSCERDRREQRAWGRYMLPDAVLAMKQAWGRLIRSSTDRGCLVLADVRLLTKGYGKVFLGALPTQNYQRLACSEVAENLRAWNESNEPL